MEEAVNIDDEVFFGPVTAKELEITWRKRKIHNEAFKRANTDIEGNKKFLNQDSCLSNLPKPSSENSPILKPSTLNVTTPVLDIKWAKKINMKKVVHPKRPAYVLSPSKFIKF